MSEIKGKGLEFKKSDSPREWAVYLDGDWMGRVRQGSPNVMGDRLWSGTTTHATVAVREEWDRDTAAWEVIREERRERA
ncbi:hypothetical protein [Actinocorallia libanotica]|uniref:Uncharacterized protein n=1 Tax=Actinocorallia libanotica TaxID=46162 RepID=A0ABN1Q0N7_9ACTN